MAAPKAANRQYPYNTLQLGMIPFFRQFRVNGARETADESRKLFCHVRLELMPPASVP